MLADEGAHRRAVPSSSAAKNRSSLEDLIRPPQLSDLPLQLRDLLSLLGGDAGPVAWRRPRPDGPNAAESPWSRVRLDMTGILPTPGASGLVEVSRAVFATAQPATHAVHQRRPRSLPPQVGRAGNSHRHHQAQHAHCPHVVSAQTAKKPSLPRPKPKMSTRIFSFN